MQEFNRVAQLEHKYTELANKNKIFSAESGDADKNESDRGHFTKGNRGRFLVLSWFFLSLFLACQEFRHILRLLA